MRETCIYRNSLFCLATSADRRETPALRLRLARNFFFMPRTAEFQRMADEDSELAAILNKFEIMPSTAATLEEAGFISVQSLALLTPEAMNTDAQLRQLPLAQRLLLNEAAKSVNSKKPISTQACSTSAKDQPIEEDIMNVWQTFSSNEMPATSSTFTPISTHTSKSKDIINFVSMHPGQNEEPELRVVDGHLHVGNKRTTRDKLSIPQYMEAAIRMRATVPLEQQEEYCEYISRIAQLAQVFSWASVLLFDKEFRRKREEKGGSWTSEEPFLMSLCLRPINTSPTNPQNKKKASWGSSQQRVDPTTGRPVCIRYNKGGCTSETCRYTHVCLSCLGPHPESKHPSPKNGQQ